MCRKYTRHHSISLKSLITTDRSKWGGYVCRSSQFFNSRDSVFYPENQEIAEFECGYIADTQLSDGSWDVPWGWDSFPDVWAVSKNRIKSTVKGFLIKFCDRFVHEKRQFVHDFFIALKEW